MDERRTRNDVRLQARQGMLDSYRPMDMRQKLGHVLCVLAEWKGGERYVWSVSTARGI